MPIVTKTISADHPFGSLYGLPRCAVSHSVLVLSLAIATIASTQAQAQNISYGNGEVRTTGVTAPSILTVGVGASATQSGAITGAGGATKAGDGTLTLTGASSYASTTISGGGLRISDGGTVANSGTLSLTGANAGLIISGIGSKLTTGASLGAIGSAAGVTMTVENGGMFQNTSGNVNVANVAGTKATLNLIGDGSEFRTQSAISSLHGNATYNILDGGAIIHGGQIAMGAGVAGAGSGSATILISGTGSRWQSSLGFFGNVSLRILDGGLMQNGNMSIGHLAGKTSNILISGAGSRHSVNSLIFGTNGTGIITVADGGTFSFVAVAPSRVLTINKGGTINIGGAVGEAATGAGHLDVASITLAGGTGALNFNHTNSDYAFALPMSGNGRINQTGSGTTRLEGDSSGFTGATTVRAGTLSVNGILGGTMDVLGGRLQGTGTVGATTNNAGGIIAPGNSIGTFTVAGDYTSNGGALEIEAKLGADNSPTDLLVVTGDTILGTGATKVRVINVGGAGAETTGDGIRIVQVDGASAADAFVLNGPAIGGAYRYNLFQHGITNPADGDWYLRAGGLAPTVPVYENYPQVLLGMVALPTLEQRVGERVRNAVNGGAISREAAIWTRIEAAHGHVEADTSTANAAYDADTVLVQAGFDGQLYEGTAGMLIGGLTAQYSHATADIFSSLGDGSNTTESHGIGANLTWYGQTGFYVDGQAQVATLRSDMSAVGIGTIGDGIHGSGYALSLEAGRKIALDATWSLTPQAQLAYASVDFDAFTDPFGANVALRQGDSLKGRLGAAVNYDADTSGNHVYGIANLTYEFLDGTSVAVSGVNVAFEPQRFGGELGFGGTYKWAGGKYALHGEALASTSFEGGYGFKGVVGFTAGL